MNVNTTYQALQAVENSEFELLIAQYLRLTRPELATLIATGVNEYGKPVPYPVDNILVLAGNPPPKCIAVATTTFERRELRRKWMGTATYEGDIHKAAKEFTQWRQDFPEIACVLYLATNRQFQQDNDLYRDAIELANSLNVALAIFEPSTLLPFLDFNAEGQYLRQYFFGIPLTRLSHGLLKEVAVSSLRHHFIETRNIISTIEIRRDGHDQLYKLIQTGNLSPIGVLGASGTGKSTLARQVGQRLNENDWLTIWMPPEIVATEITLTSSLLKTFQQYFPSLHVGSQEEMLGLLAQIGNGLTILVDDVNRVSNPEAILAKIEGWLNLQSDNISAQNTSASRANVRFVIPIWPELLNKEQLNKWELIDVSSFSNSERDELANRFEAQVDTHLDFRHFIDVLNGDPFWCGLILGFIEPFSSPSLHSLLRESYSRLMQRLADSIVRQRDANVRTTAQELISVLLHLVEHSILTDEPEPLVNSYRSENSQNQALLHLWNDQKSIGWITTYADSHEVWHWRHSRLRDVVVGRVLARYFQDRFVNNGSNSNLEQWLSNSGLADAWALATAFVIDKNDLQQLLIQLDYYQPLALAKIFRLGLFDTHSDEWVYIVDRLSNFLKTNENNPDQLVPNTRWFSILSDLAQTNDIGILEVTQTLHPTRYILAARFLNGDLLAGLKWIDADDDGDFPPAISDHFLEQTIAGFSKNQSDNRQEIVNQLINLVNNEDLSKSVLTLAGYLGWDEFAEPLGVWWSGLTLDRQLPLLIAFLWMICRCGNESSQPYLTAGLSLVHHLKDEGQDGEIINRYISFQMPIEHSFTRWDITRSAAQTWAERVNQEQDPDLRADFCYVARIIDQPETVEAFVRWCAENGHGFMTDYSESLDPRAKRDFVRVKIASTPEAHTHLWRLIENESEHEIRQWAFIPWKYHVRSDELSLLRTIPPDDPLFEQALKVRLKLFDESALELLTERVNADPATWIRYLSLFIDRRNVFEVFMQHIDQNEATAYSSELVLQYLPEWGLQELINQKEGFLLKTHRSWYYLWRTDSPIALRFVQKAIEQASLEDLKHFFSRGGFPFPVSLQMLNALIPVLHYFDFEEQRRLARLASKAGYSDWVQSNLLEAVLADKRLASWWTEEDIEEILNQVVALIDQDKSRRQIVKATNFFSLLYSSDSKYGAEVNTVLKRWLGASPTPSQIRVAALLLIEIGTSVDISWWEPLQPNEQLAVNAWHHTLFELKRRKWQS